jgi:hypothetical protein
MYKFGPLVVNRTLSLVYISWVLRFVWQCLEVSVFRCLNSPLWILCLCTASECVSLLTALTYCTHFFSFQLTTSHTSSQVVSSIAGEQEQTFLGSITMYNGSLLRYNVVGTWLITTSVMW